MTYRDAKGLLFRWPDLKHSPSSMTDDPASMHYRRLLAIRECRCWSYSQQPAVTRRFCRLVVRPSLQGLVVAGQDSRWGV
jgi:hypothetical protein